MNVNIYRAKGYWHVQAPGACGSGFTIWDAIADMLNVWNRRGKPGPDAPIGGADWVVHSVVRKGREYSMVGTNLNCPPGGHGRLFIWTFSDPRMGDWDPYTNPRYEFLPGAEVTSHR
jgi:hypothetical protein